MTPIMVKNLKGKRTDKAPASEREQIKLRFQTGISGDLTKKMFLSKRLTGFLIAATSSQSS